MLQCNQEAFVVVVVSDGRQPTRQCVRKSIPRRLNPSFGFVSAVTSRDKTAVGSVVRKHYTTQFAVVDQPSTSGRLIVHPPVSVTSDSARVGTCGRVTIFDRKKRKRQLKFGYCHNEANSLPDYSWWVTPTSPSRRARCRKIRVDRQISVSYELTR